MELEQLNRYRIGPQIGEGKWAKVFLGDDQITGQKVAIKMIKPEVLSTSGIEGRFKSIVSTLTGLRHPSIARTLDFFLMGNQGLLISEYVEGKKLNEYIQQITGAIPEGRVIPFFKRILDAFAFAHASYIFHFDIQPSNLLFMPSGEPKILDFGFFSVFSTDKTLSALVNEAEALPYKAPELLNPVTGSYLEPKCDIYSLGIVLFELLTGRTPFSKQGLTEFEYLSTLINQPVPPPSHFYPHISTAMDRVVLKATHKNPNERFSSIHEFVEALERIERGENDTFESYNAPSYTPPSYPPVESYPVEPYDQFYIKPTTSRDLSVGADLPLHIKYPLATIGQRLGAHIIDNFVLWSLIFLSIRGFPLIGLAVFIFLIFQWKMLAEEGQTIGKKLMKIRILKTTGDKGDFVSNVVVRQFISSIPPISVIDNFLGLGKDRRCLHDLLAGTMVVDDEMMKQQSQGPDYQAIKKKPNY